MTMYIPQLFETISQPIHAERIANAGRQQLACVPFEENATMRASVHAEAYRRLAHAVGTLAVRAARLRYTPDRLPFTGE
jgi:hypothetical protein